MKNKVFTVTVFNGKTVRIILSEKMQCYYLELNDIKNLFEIKIKDLPSKYQGNVNYFDIRVKDTVKKFAVVDEEELEVIKNFSKHKEAENFAASLKTIIADIKRSYSGYVKGMVLPREEQDELIGELESKSRKVNILEGQVEALKEGAKLFYEFTGNSTLVPLRIVHTKLKYKTTYNQLLGHLRQCGAIDESCNPTSSLVENGCFRTFVWSSRVGDQEKKTTQMMVSEKGIKYINEILEKANGRVKKK